MNWQQMEEDSERLLDAASVCDDDLGDYWHRLAGLWTDSPSFCGSDEFSLALADELRWQANRLDTEFEVVEQTETRTVRRLIERAEASPDAQS